MKLLQNKWIRSGGYLVALLIAFAVGASLRTNNATMPADGAEKSATIWTCSMHPQIQLPEPGLCPICNMDLIPLDEQSAGAGEAVLTLSSSARAAAGVETAVVERRNVDQTLRISGKLEADETRIREIAARVSGRIDKLYIDYTGVPVRKGQELFDLYSPELFSSQEELLQAIRAEEELSRSPIASTRRSATRTVEAARERLRLWGLSSEQIADIEKRARPSDHVTITAPISGVVLHKDALEGSYVETGTHVYAIADLSVLWLKLDVYESDVGLVSQGQKVVFQTDAHPGEVFTGTVAFVDPFLDERSRSVKVRVNVSNPDGRLKPGLFARATLHAEVADDGGRPPLVIPATAPLITGSRAIVYVELPGRPGEFEGREVLLGPQTGDSYVVREGLEEGERVVSNGSFKIDSALQILARPSMMSLETETDQQSPVPPEFHAQVDSVLSLYFSASTALSLDDLAGAQAAAGKLPSALGDVDEALVPSAEQWRERHDVLVKSARAISSSKTIGDARLAFYDLSANMILLVEHYGVSPQTPAYVYHCPMAMDGDGADWLQTVEGTENPFYGSRMYRCGSQTAVINSPTADAQGSEE